MEIQKGHHTFVVFVFCFHLFSLYIITVFFQRKPKKRTEKPSAKHQKKDKMKKKKKEKSHNSRDLLIVTPKAKNGFSSHSSSHHIPFHPSYTQFIFFFYKDRVVTSHKNKLENSPFSFPCLLHISEIKSSDLKGFFFLFCYHYLGIVKILSKKKGKKVLVHFFFLFY